MKKNTVIIVFALLILTGVCHSSFSAEAIGKFAIGEWRPYTGKNLAGYGMAAELVTAACKASGIQAEYSFMPWKRAESSTLHGVYLGTFPYIAIERRLQDFTISDTLFRSQFSILMHQGNPKTNNFVFNGVEDLKGYTVGIVNGTDAVYNPLAKIGIHTEPVETAEQNLQKLERNRIDFYIDDVAVISHALITVYGEKRYKLFVFSKNNFSSTNDFRIMFSKSYPNNKALADKINKGLQIIRQTGEYQSIVQRYGLDL